MGEKKRKNQILEDVMKWAFGEDYHNLEGSGLADRWNQLHGDLFKVTAVDDPRKAMEKISNAYLGAINARAQI